MARLAVNGGKALFKPGDFEATWPVVDEKDVQAVSRVTASGQWGRLTAKPLADEFEKAFAEYHDAKYCLAVMNGTVAIETALRALGIEPGDEVIVTPMTFIASASAVILARAVPVFADIDPETYQISAESVEARITSRTRGILVVHYAGYPSDMDAVKRLARKRKLFVLEDCAHAHGTEWRGRKVGAIGDAGAFSFQMSKSLAAGEGGAVTTDGKRVHEKAYAYHHIGRTLWAKKYEHTLVGPNYRITEFQAAILRTQLRKLTRQTQAKMRNVRRFFRQISDIPGLVPLKEDPRITQRGYYFVVLRYIQDEMKGVHRSAFLQALQAEGVPIFAGYGEPVHHIKVFKANSFGLKGCPISCRHYGRKVDYSKVKLPVAEHAAYNEQLTIAHQFFLYAGNVDKFTAGIRKVCKNLDELPGGRQRKRAD